MQFSLQEKCDIIAIYSLKDINEAGYKTILVTDHFQSNVLDTLGDIPWEDKVTIFMAGFYRVKVAAEKVGMHAQIFAILTPVE